MFALPKRLLCTNKKKKCFELKYISICICRLDPPKILQVPTILEKYNGDQTYFSEQFFINEIYGTCYKFSYNSNDTCNKYRG